MTSSIDKKFSAARTLRQSLFPSEKNMLHNLHLPPEFANVPTGFHLMVDPRFDVSLWIPQRPSRIYTLVTPFGSQAFDSFRHLFLDSLLMFIYVDSR